MKVVCIVVRLVVKKLLWMCGIVVVCIVNVLIFFSGMLLEDLMCIVCSVNIGCCVIYYKLDVIRVSSISVMSVLLMVLSILMFCYIDVFFFKFGLLWLVCLWCLVF